MQVEELLKGANSWNKWRLKLKTPDLYGAQLAKADLADINLNDADLRQANLMSARLEGARLSNANLGRANLRDANLTGANLDDADFSEAKLIGTNLRGASLNRAYLGGANLAKAILHWTNLSNANLRAALLVDATLDSAILRETNFSEARFGDTVLSNLDLSQARFLETCHHDGPSGPDYRTLIRSGALPLKFLRGCGLPDQFIDYLPSLLNQPVQFYSCFISYSTKDQEFADRLYADLQNKGVRCWFAPHNIQGGKKIHEQIDEAILVYEKLLLVLSRSSMKSEWVKTEIAKARKREIREKRRMLFPLGLVDFESLREWECFDGDTGKDSAREIREYYILDFSSWKDHNLYKKAFDRLLHDLKSVGTAPYMKE